MKVSKVKVKKPLTQNVCAWNDCLPLTNHVWNDVAEPWIQALRVYVLIQKKVKVH